MVRPLYVFIKSVFLMAVMLTALSIAPRAIAAVVYKSSLNENPPLTLGAGVGGLAADGSGNVYAVDTGGHRVVKFDRTGEAIKAWGTEGSGNGQLYYPVGVATGDNLASGNVRVFVVDNGNHRVVTFNENGKYLSAFGSYGSGNGQLQNPTGIAVLAGIGGGTQEICVADTRNDRVSCFTEQGQWLKSFTCAGCPGGVFQSPLGISIRRLPGGAIHYLITDNYPGRIVVLNALGKHVRTIGGPSQPGELAFPDGLTVDEDGNIYVVESGGGLERVMMFDYLGFMKLTFRDSPYGPLLQPHTIAINSDGDLYVGNANEVSVHQYAIEAPRIAVRQNGHFSAEQWAELMKAFLYASYNGQEQECKVRLRVTITAKGKPWTIKLPVRDKTIGTGGVVFTSPMTLDDSIALEDALQDNSRVKVTTEANAQCPIPGTDFTSTSSFILN